MASDIRAVAHCRHRTYPIDGDWPSRCKAGISYATIPRAPHSCTRDTAELVFPCAFFTPWTDEEIAAKNTDEEPTP